MWITRVPRLRVLGLSCPRACGGIPSQRDEVLAASGLVSWGKRCGRRRADAGLSLRSGSGLNRVGPDVPGRECQQAEIVAPWDKSCLHQGHPNCGATVLLSLPVGLCRHIGSSDPGSVAPLLGILAPISPAWPECLRQCREQHSVLEGLALQERYK